MDAPLLAAPVLLRSAGKTIPLAYGEFFLEFPSSRRPRRNLRGSLAYPEKCR